ncbi:uncharacterized protein LOC116343893 [Contarinia nasturtii]|uniref:uncharacterized protein LOC116343893 n=1 Tax=Contarinia nasturtii TaxID=265458 RepID=UPI0012D4107C|nr:uncharacterized protein LOC116343893 [Contarinia nasturtii]
MDSIRHHFTQVMSMITNQTTLEENLPAEYLEHELMAFSDEILLEIFSNFNEIDLLNTAQVCRRFKAIAKEIFAKKYNGDSDDKYYEISVYGDDSKYDQKHYRMFLKIFGSEIAAINLTMERRPNKHNLLNLISKQCRFLKHVIIFNNCYEFNITKSLKSMPYLTSLTLKSVILMNFYWADYHYPHLTRFKADDIVNMDVEVLKRFLYINPQIKHLHVIKCRKFPLAVIQALRDRLKGLTTLEYVADKNEFSRNCRDINMIQLKELKITVDGSSFRNVIGAIARGSHVVQRLDVSLINDDDVNIDAIHDHVEKIIPLFKHLTSLRLEGFDLGRDTIRFLIHYVPNLVCLKLDGVVLYEFTAERILLIFRRCEHLKELELESREHRVDVDYFNLEFHREFAEIVRNRGDGVKFKLIQPDTKVEMTPHKIVKNDVLMYWTECAVSKNHSTNVHLFDLGDACLKKIFSYLDEQSVRTLYETCTRTKHAMCERIESQVFTVSDLGNVKDTFDRFGEHITKLAIDVHTNNDNEIAATWAYIGDVSERITELSIVKITVNVIDTVKLNFPNLTTLKIMSIVSGPTYIFPQMECPKLSHLEFNEGEITIQSKPTHFGITLSHLRRISLNHFSDCIGTILHSMHGKISNQIEELTIERVRGTQYEQKKLVNLATRFHNLTTFNFIPYDIELTNTKYLFQTCTKLVNLSMGIESYFDLPSWRKTLQSIKENCKQLATIRLVKHYNYFDPAFLHLVNNLLPKATLITVVFEPDFNYYKVETYRELTKSDRNKPY